MSSDFATSSGAIFSAENSDSQIRDTLPTQKTSEYAEADMKWPKKVKYRNRCLAVIYRPCSGRDSYRVSWRAAGKRQMKSFKTYAGKCGAKEFADALVAELAKGSQVPLLTAKQAQDALSIRDMLAAYQEETGRRIGSLSYLKFASSDEVSPMVYYGKLFSASKNMSQISSIT